MPSWQETLIISTGLLKKYYGEVVSCSDAGVGVNVAIWPQFNSGGSRAAFTIIRPAVDVYMAVDETAGIGAGPLVGKLTADTNYAVPIHPSANTLQFKAVTSTGDVQINWIVGR